MIVLHAEIEDGAVVGDLRYILQRLKEILSKYNELEKCPNEFIHKNNCTVTLRKLP